MSEHLDLINKRLHSEHLTKLWLFYRDFFSDDLSLLQFLRSVLENEPETDHINFQVTEDMTLKQIDERGEAIPESVYIPRRMINAVERLVSVARDMELIRTGKDIFKIVFIVTCVETLQNITGNDKMSKRQQLLDFFLKYTSEEDKRIVISKFQVVQLGEETEHSDEFDRFSDFVESLNEFRNNAVHEGEYWDYFFIREINDDYPISIWPKEASSKTSSKGETQQYYRTFLTYREFEAIFVRTCINFISNYLSGLKQKVDAG